MTRAIEFVNVYRLYRSHHNTIRHSLQSAYRIAVQRLPF